MLHSVQGRREGALNLHIIVLFKPFFEVRIVCFVKCHFKVPQGYESVLLTGRTVSIFHLLMPE